MNAHDIGTVEMILSMIKSQSHEQLVNTINQSGGKELLLQDMEEHKREIQSEIEKHEFVLSKLNSNKQIIEGIIEHIKNI
jgi:hypothetical protein